MFRHLEPSLIGDTMNMVYGIIATLSAGVAITEPSGGIPVVQYGALGLCASMVYFLCKHITETHKSHSEERKVLIQTTLDISNKAIECYSDLTAELKGRMCLVQKHDIVEKMEQLAEKIDKEKE